jgi:hypothetical protein
MRYRIAVAVAGWCTERTVRSTAAFALVGAVAACGGSPREERGQSATGTIDRRAVSSAVGATGAAQARAQPLCPATGSWHLCSVVARLDRAGLAPRQQSGQILEPPLSSTGVAVLLGKSELRIFLYADRAARERDQAKLDTAKYVTASRPLSMQVEPTLIVSENLLAILRSRSDHQRERVSDALTAGPPQRPGKQG